MPCRVLLTLLPLFITILFGSGGCASSNESTSSDSAQIETPEDDDIEESAGSGDRGVAIDTQGSITGSMTVIVSGEEMSVELKHVVAYRFEYQLAGPPTRVSTWVLMTPDPISIEDLQAQFEKNQNDLMEAYPLFPDGAYLMMEIDSQGDLRQVSGHALDIDSTTVGAAVFTKVEQEFSTEGGRLKGEVRFPKGKDDALTFDCTIDVLHFSQ